MSNKEIKSISKVSASRASTYMRDTGIETNLITKKEDKKKSIDKQSGEQDIKKSKKAFRYRSIKLFLSTTRFEEFKNSRIQFTEYLEQKVGISTSLLIDIEAIFKIKLDRRVSISATHALYAKLETLAKHSFTTVSRMTTAILENCTKKRDD